MSKEEEALVNLVSKYEELYDMANRNYSNNEVKDNIWKEIGEEMNLSASYCKDKWKKLRDNFRKAVKSRKTKSGDPAKKFRPWKLENQMTFLLPHMSERTQVSNLELNEDEAIECNEEDTRSIISSPPLSNSSVVSTSAPKSRAAPKSSVADILQNYLKDKQTNRNSSIRNFFLSMADTTENLPLHLQIEVKKKVFKAVTEAEVTALSYSQYSPANPTFSASMNTTPPIVPPNPSYPYLPINEQQDYANL